VFYACDIKTKGSVPGPVLNFISKSALKQATSWVKKESEAAPDATVQDKFASEYTKKVEQMQQELVGAGVGKSASRFSR
jgi:hypothetical protein